MQSLQVCQDQDGPEENRHATCCAYSANGMNFVVGTSSGVVRVFDVRSSRPVSERDHMNGYDIRSVCFHVGSAEENTLLVGSCDKKSVKVWDASSGAMRASVESAAAINHLTFCPNSGLFFCANDQQRVKKDSVDVNTGLHGRLQASIEEANEDGASKKRKEAATKATSLLTDNRFKDLFEDADFAILDKGVEAEGTAEAPSLAELTGGVGRKKRKGGRQ